MSTDRELLELAAKAAGYVVDAEAQRGRDEAGYGRRGLFIKSESTAWNPLTDDGHALRLAVRLNICVDQKSGGIEAWNYERRISSGVIDGDPYAATRRAIVRAAAEIGRLMTSEGATNG